MLCQQENTTNPWFREYWNCSQNATCSSEMTTNYNYAGRIIDVVTMYALAIQKVINTDCGKTDLEALECVSGPRLLKALYETNFVGLTGLISIDAKGDRLSTYQLLQVLPSSSKEHTSHEDTTTYYDITQVGEYDSTTNTYRENRNLIWKYHQLPAGKTVPVSLCSNPCAAKQIHRFQENECCWTCHDCRANEYMALNGTFCKSCPHTQWPDDATNWTTCINIPPTTQPWPILVIVFGTALLICCLAIQIFLLLHRHKRVIKACSLRLSCYMLFAISLGCIAIITLQVRPNKVICQISYWLFCLSFAILYGPLLVRSLCIYRIFDSARKSIQRPKLVGPTEQMLLVSASSFIQVSYSNYSFLEERK